MTIGIRDHGFDTVCPACMRRGMSVPLHFRCLAGMRLFSEVNGRRRMDAKCPECKRAFFVDGGKVDDD